MAVVHAQNCEGCKPAPHIATCTDLHCYRCGINEYLNPVSLNCQCVAPNYRINGFCGVCPAGYTYNPITQWCDGIDTCGPNQVLVNGICQCQPGLQVIQNVCQRCPVNQTYYPQYDACRCSPGYSSINGSCIIVICAVNQVYSNSLQACVCAFGFYLINGTCGQCANNQIYTKEKYPEARVATFTVGGKSVEGASWTGRTEAEAEIRASIERHAAHEAAVEGAIEDASH